MGKSRRRNFHKEESRYMDGVVSKKDRLREEAEKSQKLNPKQFEIIEDDFDDMDVDDEYYRWIHDSEDN